MKNLAKQIVAVRKGSNERNISLFADQVDKLINDQIKLKKEEIADIKQTLKEYEEEAMFDFADGLIHIDDAEIKSSGDRKEYAEEYVSTAINNYGAIQDEIASYKADIDTLTNEIKSLEALADILNKINIPVEKED